MINELQVTADQTRWKFNALLKKYKECIDNNSKSGRNLMTFAYFNEMQDMFGHRQNINCNHVIGSSFFESERQSSSFVESNQQISSEVKRKQASSSTSESLPTKISKIECQQSLNMAPFEHNLLKHCLLKHHFLKYHLFFLKPHLLKKEKKVEPDLQHMLPIQNWN